MGMGDCILTVKRPSDSAESEEKRVEDKIESSIDPQLAEKPCDVKETIQVAYQNPVARRA